MGHSQVGQVTAKWEEGEGEHRQIRGFGDYSGNQALMQTVTQQLLQTDRTGDQTANDLVVVLDQRQCQQRPVGKTGGCSYCSSKRQQLQLHFGQLQLHFGQLARGALDGREQWGVAVAWAKM